MFFYFPTSQRNAFNFTRSNVIPPLFCGKVLRPETSIGVCTYKHIHTIHVFGKTTVENMSMLLHDVPYIKPSKMYFSLNSEKEKGSDLCLLTFIFPDSSFLIFNYFNWEDNYFIYCDGFCHTSTWIGHVSPSSWTPSTSLLTRSLWIVPEHWLWVPCFVHQTCTDHSILHMVICMFQCYSLKSSHPRLLPLSPKVCSSHLCLPLLPCM